MRVQAFKNDLKKMGPGKLTSLISADFRQWKLAEMGSIWQPILT
jgi:hypothetical protein